MIRGRNGEKEELENKLKILGYLRFIVVSKGSKWIIKKVQG